MDVKELLKLVDESMFAKTGKRLNDLQRKVIEGALNHQKYVDIAESFERSEGHVKDTGYELLQMLSDIFEEPVRKGNLKSVLERQKSITFNVSDGSMGNIADVINCVNFNSDRPSPKTNQVLLEKSNSQQNKQISKIKKLQDLGLTNDEIAELLEIPLESITGTNLEESA
jgi:DNA-directed RNA polymerase specialized sigma24 family protein